jgi:hypothetical protein
VRSSALRILAVVVTLIAALTVLWWSIRDDPVAGPEVAAPVFAAPDFAHELASEPAVAVVGIGDRISVLSVEAAPELAIECVRDFDGSPVPAARIEIQSPVADADADADADASSDGADQNRITDTAGRVVLHGVADRSTIVARADGWFGCALYSRGVTAQPLRLRLSRDTGPVRARVVDVQGRPVAHMPVHLSAVDLTSARIDRQYTNAEGIAVFDHARARFALFAPWNHQLFIGLEMVATDPVAVALDPERLPAAPIDLVAPPFGSIAIEVVDWDGRSFEELPADLQSLSARVEESSPEAPIVAQGSRSPLVFEAVQLGLDVLLMPGNSAPSRYRSERVAGPSVAGECIQVRLHIRPDDDWRGAKLPLFTGAVLDAKGVPCRDADVRMWIAASTVGSAFRTRGDGRFCARPNLSHSGLDGAFPTGKEVTFEIIGPVSNDLRRTRRRYQAKVALPPIAASGDIEFGAVPVVLVADEPLLVSGRVLDPLGNPIHGIRVQAVARVGPAEPELDPFRAEADVRGRFHIFGETSAKWLTIWASGTGLARESSSALEVVPVGKQEHELVIVAGSLSGRLLVDEGVDPRGLRLRCGAHEYARPELDGSFVFPSVDLRVERLTVELPGHHEALAFVEGLELIQGGMFRDPRLDPLDLRGKVVPWHVHFVDRVGNRLRDGRVVVRELPDAKTRREESGFGLGGVHLLLPHPRFEILARSEGFESVRIERDAAEQQVLLRRTPTLALTVPGGLPAGLRLCLSLRPSEFDGEVAEFAASDAWLEAGQTIEADSPCLGRVRVEYKLRRADQLEESNLAPLEPEFLDVTEFPSTQQHVLKLDRAKIEAALRATSR